MTRYERHPVIKRILLLVALLCASAPVFADASATPWSATTYVLKRGTTNVATGLASQAACTAAELADVAKRGASATYTCVGTAASTGTWIACPPQPAAETQTAQCPAGTTGRWPQTRTYASAAAPTCWAAGAWAPLVAPAGTCVSAPVTWTECAQENGTCTFTGIHNVRYGTATQYVIKAFLGSAACTNAVFGDPAVGQWKTCMVDSTPTTVLPPAPPPVGAVPVQGSISAAQSFASMGGNIQLLGTYPSLNTVPETGINGVGNVLGSPLRFGKVPDPTGSGRTVLRYALSINDPDTAGTVKRVDTVAPNGSILKDTIYWAVMEVFIPANTYFANDSSVFSDIHIGANCCSGNWGLQLNKGVFQIAKTWDSGSGEQSTWTTVSPQPPADKWLKIIVQWKANATGANGAFIKAWVNGVQVYNDTGPNTVPGGGDYAKFGYYNYTISNGGDTSRPEREVFWRSYYLVKDAGYTLAQVTALLQ